MLNYFGKSKPYSLGWGLVNLNQSPFPESILYLNRSPSEIISGLVWGMAICHSVDFKEVTLYKLNYIIGDSCETLALCLYILFHKWIME